MEAITYDRAQAYRSELPPEALSTWQPRRLLAYLTEIDPKANLPATIAIGIEHVPGVAPPDEEMVLIGTDNVLSTKTLKKHYDAIGGHLHMPTMAQVEAGKVQDNARLRKRLEGIILEIELVLASEVQNVVAGPVTTLEHCIRNGCGERVSRLLPFSPSSVEARCSACGALYEVTYDGKAQPTWTPKGYSHPCPTPDCAGVAHFWPDELKPGTRWRCDACNSEFQMFLGVEAADGAHAVEPQQSSGLSNPDPQS